MTRWTIVALAVAFLSGTLLNMALSLQPASAPPDGLLWRGDEASASATTRGRQPRRRVAIVTSNAFGKPAGSGANQLAALRSGPGVLDDHFAASHACYAALHGYDYHMELSTLLEKELGHHQGPVSSYINGYWSKVAAIRKWYYSGLYDWLWWVDYDTLFLNLTRGLEDTLDELEAGGYHLLFPQEHTHSRVVRRVSSHAICSPRVAVTCVLRSCANADVPVCACACATTLLFTRLMTHGSRATALRCLFASHPDTPRDFIGPCSFQPSLCCSDAAM